MIITVTLNPALDQIMFVNKLERNQNNKLLETVYDIGGKATHVSVVLSKVGIENIATGILAGHSGQKVQQLMEQKGVPCDFVWQEGAETRITYILVQREEKGSYMLTNRGFPIAAATIQALKDKLSTLTHEGDIVVFAGGIPINVDESVYQDLLQIVKAKQGKLVVDATGPFLREGIKARPYLIKPNEHEFKELIQKNPQTDGEYVSEIKKLLADGVEIVALSLGKSGSIIGTKQGFIRLYPPKIQEVNDVGCGDVFLGGALSMLSQGKSIEESFRFATAISASKATHEGSSEFDLEQTKQLMDEVKIESLKEEN